MGASGSGGIDVPAADAGRGWCLVVYTDESLSRVLATRPV